MATISVNGAAPKWGGPRRRALKEAGMLADRFMAAARHVGLFRETTSAAGIPGLAGPQVIHVELGDRPYLMVRILSGQLMDDFVGQAERLAAGMRVDRVRITQRARGYLKVELDPEDPLGVDVPVADPIASGVWPIEFGRLETGKILAESLVNCGHLAVQGQTGSGKSRWLYGVLSQLAGASQVQVSGIDPTAKLLGPWQGTSQGSLICTDASYEAMEATSADLVADMRRRISAIPEDLDYLPVSRENPLRVIVLEEWANALTIASVAKGKAKGLDTDLGKNVQMLLAEGRKAGFRILMVSQRMEANLIGAFNRDNVSHRFSFRVFSKEGMRMLHEGIPDDVAAAHMTADPGIALVQAPTIPLARLRAPTVSSYSEYRNRVLAAHNAAWNTAA